MKSQNLNHLLFSLVIIFTLTCCKTTEINTTVLNGMIYDVDNKPVPNAEISITDTELTTTDVYGHFTLSNLNPDSDYTIIIQKEGYETQSLFFTFSTISSVMYIRLYSINQLLSLAEDSIKTKDYNEALQYLNRASTINSNKASVSYLQAVIQYKQKNYQKAEQILLSLINEGYNEQYIFLFLADIYEYELNDPMKTEDALKKALQINYNPNIEARLNNLYD